ncbi:MAG: holo-ACP synthase [Anaerolineaceae bacterium]|nr:holo-ACP synthase [Anaerolineaceae bacterium]
MGLAEAVVILRTGVDIVEINRLTEVNPAIRRRFLIRVYTPLELEQVGNSDASLAGRFAAKEAVSKVLGSGIGPVSWQDIEIRRGPAGAPVLQLYGRASLLAEKLGLTQWSVSISHSKTEAIAFAVALGDLE